MVYLLVTGGFRLIALSLKPHFSHTRNVNENSRILVLIQFMMVFCRNCGIIQTCFCYIFHETLLELKSECNLIIMDNVIPSFYEEILIPRAVGLL